MVNPLTRDTSTLNREFTRSVVKVADLGGELGDEGVFVAIHDGLEPEAFLRLGEHELFGALEGDGVHVFWGRGAELGDDGFFEVVEDAGGSAEVVAGGFEALGGCAWGGRGEFGVEGGKVVEDVGAFELEVVLGYCWSSAHRSSNTASGRVIVGIEVRGLYWPFRFSVKIQQQ